MTIFASLLQVSNNTLKTLAQTNWAGNMIAILLATLLPLKDFVYFIVFLLFIDALTSIFYQYTQRRSDYKNAINALFNIVESGKLRISIIKLFFYVITIITIFWFETTLLQVIAENDKLQVLSLTNVTAMLICSVEIFSILENVSKITHNPIYSIIANLFKRKIEETSGVKIDKNGDKNDENK